MRNLPTVTKNILLANCIIWLLDAFLQRYGVYLVDYFGLFNWTYAPFAMSGRSFHLWQPFTYMFLHANFNHLFCNMFAVLMFGPALEEQWGERRYLLYYLVCGLGAAFVQEIVWMLFSAGQFSVTIGASGAVFGILFAFGWLFPNVPLYLFFIPIPIRARVFVIIYAVIELFAGLANIAGDNVAHFAHLGGLLFGWLLIRWWQSRGVYGVASAQLGESQLWRRVKQWWRDRHPNNDATGTKGGRDFSQYHYHSSESNDD